MEAAAPVPFVSGGGGTGPSRPGLRSRAPGDAPAIQQQSAQARNYEQQFQAEANFPHPDTPTLADTIGLELEIGIIRNRVMDPFRYRQIYGLQNKTHQNLLMYGPGGTGKTSIAQAIARELNLEFFPVRPSQIQTAFQGETRLRWAAMMRVVRQLAQTTTKNGVLLLLDEGEELLKERTGASEAADLDISSEFKQDFTNPIPRVILVVNTNLPNSIKDSGVLRRFGVKLYIGLPNGPARLSILEKYIRDVYQSMLTSECDNTAAGVATLIGALKAQATAVQQVTEAYTPAELADMVRLATSQGENNLDHLAQLRFCRLQDRVKRGGTRTAVITTMYSVMNPATGPPPPAIVAAAQPKNRGKRDSPADASAVPPGVCVSPDDLEGVLRNQLESDDHRTVICWPVITPETLFGVLSSNVVKRSVSLQVMQQFYEYSSRVLVDQEGSTRIRAFMQLLEVMILRASK
jgi:DNA polymerase III delta prime subunit